MAVAVGEPTYSADVIVSAGSTTITANGSNFTTTEATQGSIVCNLINGETYGITVVSCFIAGTASGAIGGRIREDTLTGNQLGLFIIWPPATTTGMTMNGYCEYTATATGSKTFVFTAQDVSGTATCSLKASSSQPTIVRVTHITQ